jgi:predicted nucleic acid-binding protein
LTLDDVPSGARVFIDSTIFIYHATAVSVQCRGLLERCESGDVAGVSSALVLAEVAHRLMTIEAVASGTIVGRDVVKKLRGRPDVVRQLHVYQEQVDRVPLIGIEILPLDSGALVRSAEVRRESGLLVNDSLVVITARDAGIAHVASGDPDFSRIEDFTLYRPSDLE